MVLTMIFLFVVRMLHKDKLLGRNIAINSNPLPMEATFFAKYESELRKELEMADKYRRVARKQMNSLASTVGSENTTFIGVHVRRTDYVIYR